MDTYQLVKYWILLFIFSNLLVVSIIMLWTGKFPPPLSRRKANPYLSTALHIIGMTGTLVYGTPELLKLTVEKVFG